ncbi:MAG: NAD-dependent epimerase/dehydratase family protein [Myxococcales bacterium]|nr:MAG: NAD-dependent epimerase/dehydratase family protein [Myxococcales bacterium]
MSGAGFAGRRVLVTGGAGFIGSHLVDRLVEEGPAALGVIDNLFLGKEANLREARRAYPELRFYKESVADEAAFRQVVADFRPDTVFNLATVPLPASLERPRFAFMENMLIGVNTLELLREGAYPRLVHFSTSEVFGSAQAERIDETHPRQPHTPYAASKAANDALVESYQKTFGLRVLVLRPFNNYGPRQNENNYAGVIPRTIRRLLAGEPAEIYGDGAQTRDFLFVNDCVRAVVAASLKDELYGGDYNLGSGAEVGIGWLIRELTRQIRPDIPPLSRPVRPGDVRRHLADGSRLEAAIGKIATTPFEQGLAATVAWYRQTLSVQGE